MTVSRTLIYARSKDGETEFWVGWVDADLKIFALRRGDGEQVGRVDGAGRVFRQMSHDERELGTVTPGGAITSHGLFEGGDLGWVDPDGVVVQAGLILGEEEVGRVEGPHPAEAAAALLLLFLPDQAEEDKRMAR